MMTVEYAVDAKLIVTCVTFSANAFPVRSQKQRPFRQPFEPPFQYHHVT